MLSPCLPQPVHRLVQVLCGLGEIASFLLLRLEEIGSSEGKVVETDFEKRISGSVLI